MMMLLEIAVAAFVLFPWSLLIMLGVAVYARHRQRARQVVRQSETILDGARLAKVLKETRQ